MRNRIIQQVSIVLLITNMMFSCKENNDQTIKSISIDFDNVMYIDISKGKVIEPETTNSSLLYDIVNIEFIKEKLIIQTRGKVVVFDKEGKFLSNVGTKGNGPDEYTNLGSMHIKNEHIYLYDHMLRKVLCFDENGDFISSTVINQDQNMYFPSAIFPFRKRRIYREKYVSRRSCQYTDCKHFR